MAISVTRAATAPPTKAESESESVSFQFGQALVGVASGVASLFRPFVALVMWQVFFGLFAYFYPAVVAEWEKFTHVPWVLVAVVFAFLKLARKP